MTDPLFWTIAVLAVFIVAMSKSGLPVPGMIAVPMLILVMPARDAAGMLLPLLLVMDAIAIWTFRKNGDWHILRIMLPGAMIGTLVGWALWSVVSDAMVELAVGIITLLFVLDAWFPIRKQLEGLPPSRGWGTFWGGLAGFTSFISHTGGPPFQIYVLPRRLDPVTYSGTNAWFFAIVNSAKLIPTSSSANFGRQPAARRGPGAGRHRGGLIGVFLVRRISTTLFYQLAYILVFVLALKLIYDGVAGVFFSGAARSEGSGMDTGYRIDHIALLVRDLEESARFYTEVIGIAEVPNPMGGTHVRWFEIGAGQRIHMQPGDIRDPGGEADPLRPGRARLRRRPRAAHGPWRGFLRHEGHARRGQRAPGRHARGIPPGPQRLLDRDQRLPAARLVE